MTIVVILLFWSIVAYALMRPGPMLLYVFFGSMSFETLAVLPPAVTGGMTITPTPAVALLLIAQTFGSRDGLRRLLALALRLDRLGLLFAFWLVAVYTSLFMPRLFAGDIGVIPFRGADLSRVVPLVPTSQNISQLGYLTISVFTVFVFADRLRDVERRREAITGLVIGGVVVVITGTLDFLSQFLPLGPLLAPFRTAGYALLTEVVVFGGKRVVGLTSEASAYGGLALSYLILLYFLRRTIDNARLREVIVPGLVIALAGFVYLAKSTGAYVGFALFAGVVVLDGIRRYIGARKRVRAGLVIEFWALYLIGLAILFVVMLNPGALDPVVDLMNRMVFEKASSSSYDERGLWRSTAWAAFWSSYGIGIGVGSTRSSSEVAGIFAATGLLGALFYYSFFLQTLFRRATRFDLDGQEIVKVMRLAFLPAFFVRFFVGTADFGAIAGFMFGLMAAIAVVQAPRPAARSMRRATSGPPPQVPAGQTGLAKT